MFTGIVEAVGTISAAAIGTGGARFTIDAPVIMEDVGIGDSIACDGACLTVVDRTDTAFAVDVVTETLARTMLGDWIEGTAVNVERAMPATGRFDGHIVQGHVDGVGTVAAVAPAGDGRRVTVEAPETVARYVVEKGSITVAGISLTVASVDGDRFDIALIPHTLGGTTSGRWEPGDRVNLEADVIAKYVERLTGTGS
jgi:riboflavin synthase